MCNCIEEWKIIEGEKFNAYISSKGKVVSDFYKPPRIVKGTIDECGYRRTTIHQQYYRINVLVAQVFLNNGKPIDYINTRREVEHLDTNKLNNCVCNLKISTKIENLNNPITLQKHRESSKGENNGMYGKTHTVEARRKISEARKLTKGKKRGKYKKKKK